MATPEAPIADPRQLAGRLLADEALRSVTFDPSTDVATLRYHDRRIDRASLAWLAELARADSRLLSQAAILPAPVNVPVECWPDPETGRASYVRTPQQATGWRRVMHLTLAGFWFALAVLGAILPGLPCTCFLLLCSYSLCRSSQRLHQKLLDSKWFGPTLRHWRLHRGVRPGVKTKALTMLLLMVGASLTFAPLPPIAWWAVAAAGVIGTVVVSRLRVVES